MPLAVGYASIAICDRCCQKYPYLALRPDGNNPGLFVCLDCYDVKDPWRLQPNRPDAIALKYPRPDDQLWPIAISVPVGRPVWGGGSQWGSNLKWQ